MGTRADYVLGPGQQKKEQQKADNADAAGGKKKKVTAAQLRVQKGKQPPTQTLVLPRFYQLSKKLLTLDFVSYFQISPSYP